MKRLSIILGLILLALALTTASAFALAINLHNNIADSVPSDCPDGQANGCWHFIIAPNNDSQTFSSITLALGGVTPDTFTFSDSGTGVDGAYIRNGEQTDNVFVPVPVGYSLTDLLLVGSWADITPGSWIGGSRNNPTTFYAEFILSHTCPPQTSSVPEPGTLLLLGSGLLGIGLFRRFRR